MLTSPDIAALAEALSKAQGEFKQPHRSKTATVPMKAGGQYSYKYSDLAELIDCTRPALTKYGLSMIQPVSVENHGVSIDCQLMHSSGQFIRKPFWFPVGDDRPQTMGSMITYGRRYSRAAMLDLAPDDDDDGQQAQEAATGEKLDVKAPRATARARQTQQTILAPAKSAAQSGYDPQNKEHQDWILGQLKAMNVPEDRWDDVGNAHKGKASGQLMATVADVMGKM